jgi:hypothetical protein
MWRLFRLGHQPVKVLQRAVLRVDVLVVGDVVAEIHLRRGINGREPDGVDAQFLQVVEPRGNAVQVADAVSVRVLKTARVDLVDDGVLPPVNLDFAAERSGNNGTPVKPSRRSAVSIGRCAEVFFMWPVPPHTALWE